MALTEDAQSEAGVGGQLGYVVCPRKLLADGESQNFERLNFFQDVCLGSRWEYSLKIPFGETVNVRFVRVERPISSVGPFY